ncbi:class I SAM-dependent methyltransferase [Paenibacillus mesotrionivorans]|uniref:Class I SAM-dependent methyltransferase n=1 Tax=Paenibacillus mesotrionivorans TaxID=3160968 RepID=A0ACC7NVF1_9BACL
MRTVPFDQYQRYNNAAEIINNARQHPGESFRILEVGANEHQNLEYFLPNDDIKYLDIQLPEELLNNPKYVLGDATEMNFEDEAFDIIIALDVFEHIPPERRNSFIDELYRVSAKGFIISAPFQTLKVVQAEKRLNSLFRTLFNQNYTWLWEHKEYGLPLQSDLEEYLKKNNMNYNVLSHGDIRIWEKLMGLHFISIIHPSLIEYRQNLDDYYNQHLFTIDYTPVEDSYRKIFIIEKDNSNLRKYVTKANTKSLQSLDITQFDDMVSFFHQLATVFILLKNQVSIADVPKDRIQIFFGQNGEYSENNSLTLDFNKEDIYRHCSIKVPELIGSINSVRIDPSDFAGAYKITNIKAINNNGEPVECQKQSGNYSFVWMNLMLFEHDDPNCIITFSNSQINEIQFDVVCYSLDFRMLIYEVKSILTWTQEQLQEAKSDIENKANIMSALKAEITDIKQNNIELVENITKVNLEFDACKTRIDKLVQENSELIHETGNLRLENEWKKSEYEKFEKELKIALEEINSIHTSRSWRIIRFLKKVFRKS